VLSTESCLREIGADGSAERLIISRSSEGQFILAQNQLAPAAKTSPSTL